MVERLLQKMSYAELADHLAGQVQESNNAAFKKFIRSREYVGGRLFDAQTWLYCYRVVKQKLQMQNDQFIVITGVEGTGKSTLALQIASVIDPDFTVKQIAYTALDFYRLVEKLPRGRAIVIDEAHRLLAADMTTTRDQHDLVLLLQEMRQAGLCVILCLPYFRGLQKYLRQHRTDSLMMVSKRGDFKYASRKALTIINEVTTKVGNMQPNEVKLPSGTFYNGGFNGTLPNNVDKEAYLKLKESKFYDFIGEKRKKLEKAIKVEETGPPGLTVPKIAALVGCSRHAVHKGLKDGSLVPLPSVGLTKIDPKVAKEWANRATSARFPGFEGQ